MSVDPVKVFSEGDVWSQFSLACLTLWHTLDDAIDQIKIKVVEGNPQGLHDEVTVFALPIQDGAFGLHISILVEIQLLIHVELIDARVVHEVLVLLIRHVYYIE